MEPVLIQSGLQKILMLDAILSYDDRSIFGERQFQGQERYCALEACAQLCAMHVRRLKAFYCHAFLLSVTSIRPLPPKVLNGLSRCEGRLTGTSQQAFRYDVSLNIEGVVPILMKLTIGTILYGKMFKKESLQQHYQQLFCSLYEGNVNIEPQFKI